MADEEYDSAQLDFDIVAEPVKRLNVGLVGKAYRVKPPKGSLALVLAGRIKKVSTDDPDEMMSALEDWLKLAVGKKDAKEIVGRLTDPDDDLDFTHIMKLVSKLSEQMTGDPTT